MGLEQRLVWKQQADGISCGPAALLMLVGALSSRKVGIHPFEAREMMGTNPHIGTTHVEMARGLGAWGIPYRRMEPQAHEDGRMRRLLRWLEAGNPALLRGMRHGGKHWILAVGMDGGRLVVADPASGIDRMSTDEVEAVLAPRGWEIWPVPRTATPRVLELGAVGNAGSREALALCAHVLGFPGTRVPRAAVRGIVARHADWDKSVALRVDGRIAACYVLRETSLRSVATMHGLWVGEPQVQAVANRLAPMRTVWGIALAARQDSRGLGYGRLVRTAPGQLGYEASFGMQLKELDNYREWSKVRPWRVDLGDMWLTAGPVSPLRALRIDMAASPEEAEFDASHNSRPCR